MFHRIVVFLIVLAVIACPMFCGVGAACCVDESHVQDISQATQKQCACCCHKSQPLKESPSDSPAEGADELCQGICGGVVILETIKIETRDDLLHAVPFEVVTAENILTETPNLFRDEGTLIDRSSGRSLRRWISSYLC